MQNASRVHLGCYISLSHFKQFIGLTPLFTVPVLAVTSVQVPPIHSLLHTAATLALPFPPLSISLATLSPECSLTDLCALLSLDSHTASITTYPKSQIGKTDWNRFTQTHNEFCVSRLYVKYRGKLNSFVHDQPRIYLPMSPLIFLCSGVPSVPSISRELAQSSRVI